MPPAAIAVVRISGPQAESALATLTGGRIPAPRVATVRQLRDPANGALLDQALTLWFPGPASATGEDLVELHLHGGRAVVRAIEAVLGALDGLRPAVAGEFTRRALDHGRIDLAEAEGLADLLQAETETQRRQALVVAGGALSREVAGWRVRLLTLSARIEALLDFSDEDDVAADEAQIADIVAAKAALAEEWSAWLARPTTERLRDGITVAIAGPPNAGKSTLLNALAQREAAIVSPIAGTTRDVIEVPLALDGMAFRFADTAGLRDEGTDAIEAIGIDRARQWMETADMLLWLGLPDAAPPHPQLCRIAAQKDRADAIVGWSVHAARSDVILSAATGEGLDALHRWLTERARTLLPSVGELALNQRQRAALVDAHSSLHDPLRDPILIAEQLRGARLALDVVVGGVATEDMLDTLFGRFCIGK